MMYHSSFGAHWRYGSYTSAKPDGHMNGISRRVSLITSSRSYHERGSLIREKVMGRTQRKRLSENLQ